MVRGPQGPQGSGGRIDEDPGFNEAQGVRSTMWEERIPRSEQVHVPVHGLGHARANLNEPVRPSRPVFNVEIPRSRGSNTSCGMGECDVWRMERQESLFNHDHRAYVLNGPGAKKETCHIAFDLGDSGMTYKVGDALGVLPENPPALVEALIQRMGWDADSMVTTSKGERTLAQALKTDVEIHRANKKFVQSLASKITRPGLPITMGMIRRTREDTNGSTVLDWNNEASSTLLPV